MIKKLLRLPLLLADRRLTVALMGFGAAAMALITWFEATDPSREVPYRLYSSWWFTSLLALVWINLFLNALRPFWWRRRRFPALAMHFGFLLILTGGFFTWKLALRGDLPISEGETRSDFENETPVFHVTRTSPRTGEGKVKETFLPVEKSGNFQPAGYLAALNVFSSFRRYVLDDGTGIEIVRAVESAVMSREVAPDPGGRGPPAVVLLVDSDRSRRISLRDGDRVLLEPAHGSWIEFASVSGPEEEKDAVRRAFGESVEIVTAAGRSIVFPIRIPEDVGKEFTREGYTIRILKYYPDFKLGQEPSPDDPPRNPALRLYVKGPAGEKTLYSFALFAFHGNRLQDGSEVRYRRPETTGPGALAVSTGGGKISVYLSRDEKRSFPAEIKLGSKQYTVKLEKFYPASRYVLRARPDPAGKGPPAFLVRVGSGGTEQWISEGRGEAKSADGAVTVEVTKKFPLGFSLRLNDAVAEFWPASSIPKAYYSLVTITDPGAPRSYDARIETNAPLFHRRFRLYQSGMDRSFPYRWSVFQVTRDPGLPMVTAGFVIMALGLFWFYLGRFVIRPLSRKKALGRLRSHAPERRRTESAEAEK